MTIGETVATTDDMGYEAICVGTFVGLDRAYTGSVVTDSEGASAIGVVRALVVFVTVRSQGECRGLRWEFWLFLGYTGVWATVTICVGGDFGQTT